MIDNYNNRICLGIPIPLSVQALPRTPPASFHYQGDLSSLQALKDFGEEFDVPYDEIEQACNLASGPADIVVILERPKTVASHNYKHPFPKFVRSCQTLWAVDDLIRCATKGARSIHTVTVLDAFAFKPGPKSHIPDERYHQLLAEMLRAKKPKVVIRCHRDEYRDPWMKQFELPGEEYRFVRKELRLTGNHKTILLQSFYLSIAVNNADQRPEYRCLLIYHFIAAFAELSGISKLHEDAEEIRQLCKEKGTRNGGRLLDWDPPIYLTKALERRYGGPQGSYPLNFKSSKKQEALRRESRIFSTMYDWLEHLAGQSNTFGALGIAHAVLFLWKKRFETNPLYKQVSTLLLLRGGEQHGWFPTENHRLPITEQLSKFQFISPESYEWTTNGLHSLEICDINKQAIACISRALVWKVGKNQSERAKCLAACNEVADLIVTQQSHLEAHIRQSSLTQLSRALRIQKLATHCMLLAKIIKIEDHGAPEPEGKRYEDLALLRDYLQQLIST